MTSLNVSNSAIQSIPSLNHERLSISSEKPLWSTSMFSNHPNALAEIKRKSQYDVSQTLGSNMPTKRRSISLSVNTYNFKSYEQTNDLTFDGIF